ncbi:dephospho-CoA kinase [Vibrio maerlii]|uniref:dephospho-CoA kinase n=1 Tax=Vibrio maerlii TaxID=2231648 RepID=UPI000E3EB3D5|nr:dephospho-CoA kinase [Vibrio maerlii]
MSFVVAITGGIASGKTTVANLFHDEFGIEIVDADVVAREVVAAGSEGLTAIIEKFGQDILTEEGELNRTKLREIIFASDEDKQWLNGLLHPMIRQKMKSDLDSISSEYGLLVVPLLVENNLQYMADRVLVVDVEEEIQIERTMLRDEVDRKQALSILKAQASRAQRLDAADDIIENSVKNQQLLPLVTDLHQKYLAMSRKNRSQ